MKYIKFIFSGETFFALFLTSGVFKTSLNFPIDLTAFFLILTALSILKRVFQNPNVNRISITPTVLFVLFLCYALFSLMYTPNSNLSSDKFTKLLLLTTPAFVFAFLLFRSRESLVKFLLSFSLIATILSLFSLPMIFERGASIGFVGFNEGNYLGLTRVGGIGLVILLFLGLLNEKLKKYRILFAISAAIVLISLLASGGRMPVVAVSVALLIGVISSIKVKNGVIRYPKYLKKILILLPLLAIPILWAYNKGFFNSLLFRFEVLMTEGGDSASGRTDRFAEAIAIWKEHVMIGSGFGGFGHYYTNGLHHDYPHNTFLEVLSELGLIGFALFAGLLGVATVRFLKVARSKNARSSNLFITVVIMSLVMFFNTMVSGDINENRMMLTFIAIICLLPAIYKEEQSALQ